MFHFKKNKRDHASHEGRERVFRLKEGCGKTSSAFYERDFTQFHNYPRYRLTVVWTVSVRVVISLEITPAKLSPRLLRILTDEGIMFFGAIRIAEPRRNHAKSSIVPVFRGRTVARKTLRTHRINNLAEDDEPPVRYLSRMEIITGVEGSFRSP
ncbi:hypothetical protein ALC62_05040 [Cyphomyrmex costatus]|uniref:Uncharacterized protein n=1 Tax=Cyphomyrmex costatus TaxID=456900 RepID=A0A195CVU0_9HYME|nr:hypothetical protein ALC62_05040 [Cyphomyrmex costatus]